MMADSDFSLLSFLKTHYPLVPITTVLKVMNKYDNDQEKCRQALESEVGKRLNALDNPSAAPLSSSNNYSNNNSVSPDEGKLMARMKELHVSHEGNSQPKLSSQERHVTTIERSVSGATGPPEQIKRPYISQSVSWTMQTPERQTSAGAQSSSNQAPTNNTATPQSAPPDFSSFFSRSATDIPNINCRTHRTSGLGSGPNDSPGSRPQQIPLSASSSPVEQRHPVKVINIPVGSSPGGSSATSQSNLRHMNFGDSNTTIASPPGIHRYGSIPNISQNNYRSEILTEAPQPVHSSSIVVNNSSFKNHEATDRRLNSSFSANDSPGSGRRTPGPPLSLNTDLLPNSSPSSGYSSGKLSTPIQASSPGIAHSKPVFVEIKSDRLSGSQLHGSYNGTNYSSSYNLGDNVRPPPLSSSFFPPQRNVMFDTQNNPMVYSAQFSQDYPNVAGFPLAQHDYMYQNPQQHRPLAFHSPSSHLSQLPTRTGYGPGFYPQFSTPVTITGYPLIPGYFPGQTPSNFSQYSHYGPNIGQSPGICLPNSPIVGQHTLGSRSSSLDSKHNMDFDAQHPPYSATGSSLSSLSSDSSSSRAEGGDSSAQPRSGSSQEETEYVRALTQHQRRQMQKLMEEANQHKGILNKLRSEVCTLENNIMDTSHSNRNFPLVEDVSGLCENNRRLQTDIQLFMNEIEMYRNGQINKLSPLNQQNFFENMPTGQQDPTYSVSPDDLNPQSSNLAPPPRPPPPIPVRQWSTDPRQAAGGVLIGSGIFRVPPVPATQPVVNSGDSEEGEPWSCSACTFSNHPALKKCEMCEMPRVMTQVSCLGPPAVAQPLSSVPPRLVPGQGLMGSMHARSGSPHSAVDHFSRAGT